MRPKKVILLADENDVELSLRSYLLETHGHRTIKAQTHAETVRAARHGGVDLVVIECTLPGAVAPWMDAIALADDIKKLKQDVPVLLVSRTINYASMPPDLQHRMLPQELCRANDILSQVTLLLRRKRGPRKRVEAYKENQ